MKKKLNKSSWWDLWFEDEDWSRYYPSQEDVLTDITKAINSAKEEDNGNL